MGHGAVADGPDEHERRRPQGPAQGAAQEVERGIVQPVQAVAQGAARVVDIGQPGGGDGGRVDVGGRVGPHDERGAGQGSDPEDGVGGGVQSGRSLATNLTLGSGRAEATFTAAVGCRLEELYLGEEC